MTIKVTITHDEPTSSHSLNVGILKDLVGYEVPQMQDVQTLEPGKSISVHVYDGSQVQVWESPLPIELKIADEIEKAMDVSKKVPAPKLDPRARMRVAKAAIAAMRQVNG